MVCQYLAVPPDQESDNPVKQKGSPITKLVGMIPMPSDILGGIGDVYKTFFSYVQPMKLKKAIYQQEIDRRISQTTGLSGAAAKANTEAEGG